MTLSDSDFQKRAKTAFIILGIWGLVAISFLLYYTTFAAKKYIDMGERLAWRKGIYGGSRGKILDCNGLKLAWTELYYTLKCSGKAQDKDLRQIQKIFPTYNPIPGRKFEITRLTPNQITQLAPLLRSSTAFKLVSVEERMTRSEPEVKKYIGQIEQTPQGELQGCSGMEKHYDKELKKTPGTYIVMLDRYGKWIQESWKSVTKPENGQDIILPVSLQSIISGEHNAIGDKTK